MAPPSRTMRSSAPIKIPNKPLNEDSDEATLEQEQDMVQIADRLDYLFYSRVLLGVQRSNGYVRGLESFFENQRCLQNIIRTRHSDGDSVDDVTAKKMTSMPQPTLKKSLSTRMLPLMPLSQPLHNLEMPDASMTDRESGGDDEDEDDDNCMFVLDL